MDAANYTYVRLDTGKEQVWIAASQFSVKVGERLSVVPEMPMENFHSKALNRDFPLIYFVSSVGRDGQAPAAGKAAAAVPAMMTSRRTDAGRRAGSQGRRRQARPAGRGALDRRPLGEERVTERARRSPSAARW